MTPWKQHVETWSHCTACHLCTGRHSVVLARGQIPCDVLFIGEAPGTAEDALGKPFIGPAGKLLDRCIEEACDGLKVRPRLAFTNLIACIPVGDDGNKTGEPPKTSITACAPRLKEFVRIAKPRAIVVVGTHAKKHIIGQAQFATKSENGQPAWLRGKFMKFAEIVHPAFILRADQSRQGLAVQKTIVTLNDLFTEM